MTVLHYPPSIDWELTSECNHNCIHCYNYWRKSVHQCLAAAGADRFALIARRIIAAKPVSLQITGGEPLMVWKQAKPAIEELLEAGICVSINTNAVLVNREIAEFLGEHHIDAFVSLPCSDPAVFDEIVNRKGAFKRACEGIHLLLDAGVRVSLNMVVTRRNLSFVYDTAKFAKEEFGVGYFSATKASFPQNADENFRDQMLDRDEFNDMLHTMLRVKYELGMRVDSAWVYSLCGFVDEDVRKQFGFNRKCTCGKYSFVVDSTGNIKACGCDSQTFGDIFDVSFAEAITKMESWRNGSLLPDICKTCRWLPYCGGGCRSDAISTNGTCCMLDSTANPSNRNGQLAAQSDTAPVANLDSGFALNPLCSFTKDGALIRISCKTNYDYISVEFAEFLRNHSGFSTVDLAYASGQGMDMVLLCLMRLQAKKLLTEEARNIHNIKADRFALLVSPYVQADVTEWVNGYAGMTFSNIRHS